MKALVQRVVPAFRCLWFIPGLLLAVISLRGQTAAQSMQSRISGIVDESSRVTLQGNLHPFARSQYDLGPAPVSMAADRLLLVLKRSKQQQADLETYLQSVQDANSPSYRKFLSPEEFGKRFGVGDADLQTIQTWLSGHGFKIDKVSAGRMTIELSGTVGQIENTFHTPIHHYMVAGKQYWANAADPQIPEVLSPVVAGFASLGSFKPKAQFIRGPSGRYDSKTHTITPTYTIGSASSGYYIFLGPADAATIYDTPNTLNPNYTGTAYDGTGVTIGIAGDSNIDLTQNTNYRATFGLPAKATTVVVDGVDPGENGDAIEAYLDTEVATGIAPNANIILYTASDTSYQSGLFLAITRALDDNQADILNVSFSACESQIGAAANQYISNLWEQAAAQGISVTVSTGDSGSAGCDNPNTETVAANGLAVNGISSTPYNIAVGGTDFDALYGINFPISFTNYVDVTNSLPNHRSALKYIPEEPWNDSTEPNSSIAANKPLSTLSGGSDNIVAAGGGLSTVYAMPAWQTGFGAAGGRNIPDVSLLAGNGFYGAVWGICTDLDTDSTGTPIADCAAGATGSNFNLTGVGGTSAAAPAFAGMLALAKQKAGSRLGQADTVLYNLANSKYATVFHDVTAGDNSVNCTAATLNCAANPLSYDFLTGYNAATGYDEASGLGSVDATQMLSNWAAAGLASTTSSLKLNGAATALTITHGQSVTVSATVTSGTGTPSGDVALVDNLSAATLPNNESIALFTLAGGTATGATTALPGGTYQVSAHYGGSSTFADSDSNAIPVTVGAESSSTKLSVVGYYDPATGNPSATPYYGLIYVFDAQPYGNSASAASPNGIATGTITFKNGTATLGSATIDSSGTAELQTTALAAGSGSFTAAFPGDASFQASTSSALPLTVVPAITAVSTPSLQPGQFVSAGTSITMSIAVSSDSAGAAPTGTVTFQNGSSTVGTVPLVGSAGSSAALAGGTASFSTTSLPVGSDNITAVYSGDGNYAGATSAAVPVTVQKVTPALTVTPSSPSIPVNDFLQVTVTPTPASGLPLPTGTVTVGMAGALQPPVTLANGTATVTIPANTLPMGADTILGSYSGDANYQLVSATTSVTVTAAAPPGLTLSGTSVTIVPGATTSNSSTITLAPTGGFTGSVTLTAAITNSPVGAVHPPTFSFGSTSPVSLTGATNGTATLTISTTAATSGALHRPARPGSGANWIGGGGVLACILLFGISNRRRRWQTMLGMIVFLIFLSGGVLSCGGGGSGSGGGGGGGGTPGTTAGDYTVTVTGTSGTMTATGTVSLTVQ
ncbi:MAG TPA: Ig-like domain repeat protein [Terracidiphilus sp.]|nr:Ig-like domain repeat protein [Terracidiphilus sp.]